MDEGDKDPGPPKPQPAVVPRIGVPGDDILPFHTGRFFQLSLDIIGPPENTR